MAHHHVLSYGGGSGLECSEADSRLVADTRRACCGLLQNNAPICTEGPSCAYECWLPFVVPVKLIAHSEPAFHSGWLSMTKCGFRGGCSRSCPLSWRPKTRNWHFECPSVAPCLPRFLAEPLWLSSVARASSQRMVIDCGNFVKARNALARLTAHRSSLGPGTLSVRLADIFQSTRNGRVKPMAIAWHSRIRSVLDAGCQTLDTLACMHLSEATAPRCLYCISASHGIAPK